MDSTGEERWVDVGEGVRLWSEATGRADGTPLLLVMGAASSSVVWPEEVVARLGEVHRVVRYDHRDTGRSSWAFDEHPYAIRDLAEDAVAVLDAWGIDRAHVVGMSMGGTLVQVLLVHHPDRLLSATLFCTGALGGAPGAADLPGPSPELLAFWETMGDERDEEAELDWRVEHWRLLNGDQLAFDAPAFRAMEQRTFAHAGGRMDAGTAHAQADQGGLDRGAELATVEVPTLVIEAPADPVYPPPNAERIVEALGNARLACIPGMGHAIGAEVAGPLAELVLEQTAAVDQR